MGVRRCRATRATGDNGGGTSRLGARPAGPFGGAIRRAPSLMVIRLAAASPWSIAKISHSGEAATVRPVPLQPQLERVPPCGGREHCAANHSLTDNAERSKRHFGARPAPISRRQRAISRMTRSSLGATAVHSRLRRPMCAFSVVSKA
jgi:hypothetical protein